MRLPLAATFGLLAGAELGCSVKLVDVTNRACDATHPCESGERCVAGTCSATACDPASPCPSGLACVQGTCTQLPGSGLTVAAVTPATSSSSPGEYVVITYDWSGGPTAGDWSISAAFIDDAGVTQFVDPFPPPTPTSAWSGMTQYTHYVPVPFDAGLGTYDLLVSVTDPDSGTLLAVDAGAGASPWPDGRVEIGTLTLSSPCPGCVNVIDYGARADGSNATATTAAFASAFSVGADSGVYVPVGVYAIDNSAGYFTVQGFSGELYFEPGAKLSFQTVSQGGIDFVGGTGARLINVDYTYLTMPTVRTIGLEGFKVEQATSPVVTNFIAEMSPSAGLLFYDSVSPTALNVSVANTLGDGLHFANCSNAYAQTVNTVNTGDDGVAFLDYSIYPDLTGGLATDLHVRSSKSRGISILGQRNVTVQNFTVDGTASSGLLCGYDATYATRVPADDVFQSGTVTNAGTVTPLQGNQNGIEYESVTSCAFSNIQVIGAANRGVNGQAPDGGVSFTSVDVQDTLAGPDFNLIQTASVTVTSCSSTHSPGTGLFLGMNPLVNVTGFAALDASLTDPLHRAIEFDSNGTVQASNLVINDDQVTPTGYVLGANDSPDAGQIGTINGVTSAIPHGQLVIQNYSPGLVITNIGP